MYTRSSDSNTSSQQIGTQLIPPHEAVFTFILNLKDANIQQLSENNNELASKNSELRATLFDLNNTIAGLKAMIEIDKTTVENQNKTIADLNKTIEIQQEIIENQDKEVKGFILTIEAKNALYDAQNAQSHELLKLMGDLNVANLGLTKKLYEQETVIGELQNTIEILEEGSNKNRFFTPGSQNGSQHSLVRDSRNGSQQSLDSTVSENSSCPTTGYLNQTY